MVPRDFQTLSTQRAARARTLAERYPASREGLLFFARIADFQAAMATPSQDFEAILAARDSLIRVTIKEGPDLLATEARRYDASACRESIRAYLANEDTTSAISFFARVLLQPVMFGDASAMARLCDTMGIARVRQLSHAVCPDCGHRPQVGCLRPQGDGSALSLVCSLCLCESPFTRLRCPWCGESDHHKIAFYSSDEFPHIQVQACETCKHYLHVVDFSREMNAIADVDEIAALPLDVWAHENGFRKIHSNMLGI